MPIRYSEIKAITGHASNLKICFGKFSTPDQRLELLFPILITEVARIKNDDDIIAHWKFMLPYPVNFFQYSASIVPFDGIPIFSFQCYSKPVIFQTVSPRNKFCPATTRTIIRFIEDSGKFSFTPQPFRPSKVFSHQKLRVFFDSSAYDGREQLDRLWFSYVPENQIFYFF